MHRGTVALALLLATPAWADADHANDPHPLATPRAAVAWAGLGGLLGGMAWYFVAGDSLGAGDPAGVMVAGGGVALTGALLGRAIDGPWARGRPEPHSAGTPALELGLAPGGTPTMGETDPWRADLGVAPRFQGDALQLILGARGGSWLGQQVAVDPRPDQAGAVALRTHRWGFDVAPELRAQQPGIDLQLLPQLWSATETVTHPGLDPRAIHREAVVAAVGARLHITERQRFVVAMGPRFDSLRYTRADDTWSPRTWTVGPIYGATSWQFDLPGPATLGGWPASSRLTVGYEHENFHGAGFDFYAVNGFFGPLRASWDLRVRPRGGAHALQASIDATLATGGGVRVALGWAPPTPSFRQEAP